MIECKKCGSDNFGVSARQSKELLFDLGEQKVKEEIEINKGKAKVQIVQCLSCGNQIYRGHLIRNPKDRELFELIEKKIN